ncbi:bifunctional nuclease family protein [Thermoanaerobacter mathranii]|uniref:bifunctional nuclease family protein n=1 Tax=Thermoanaerobacter mathranii TaxID=583357 RepID=UPI003AACFAA2
MLKFHVKAITMDVEGNFSVLLTDEEEKKVLPIVIGPLEAQNIAIPLQGITPPRPLTPDLLKSVIEELGGKPEKVVITDLKDDTYYAELYIKQGDRVIKLDSRPSDAIALAMRTDIPIFINIRLAEFTYDMADLKFDDGDS